MSSADSHTEKALDLWYAPATEVQVPQVNYSELGWSDYIKLVLLRFLAPTTSSVYEKKDRYFRDQFTEQVREYSHTRKSIKQLFLVSRLRRVSQLNELVGRLRFGEPPKQWDHEVDNVHAILHKVAGEKQSKLGVSSSLVNDTRAYHVLNAAPAPDQLAEVQSKLTDNDLQLLDEYCTSIERTRTLRSHLQDVDEDLANFAHIISTQATAELTYFRGLRDWCQETILTSPQVMAGLTDGLCTGLIAISTLGAGLVYSTVFGATRGNVGLMCYCFPFFSLGFLMPVVIQTLLRWGASLQKEVKFASQPFWTIIVAIFMGISSTAVMASLTILNVTIFVLRDDSDETLPDPPKTPVPGIIAFSATGSIFVFIAIGVLLSAIAAKAVTTLKGMRAVVSAMYGSQNAAQDALKVYLPV
ncbi:hypothetical protein GGX14DRAFT_429411 [Mycena pura]|uniref:Uncharacterized protein n=1 Tax=Mycena pura TaxID=153505 RepID=A0AAD6YKM3_9AGAR|nr:hypothetical protein GGX14DRAFT_429411 [Mycena pura]